MNAKKYQNFLFEDALASILDGFGGLLGASGGPLGACWAPLGRFLGASWALLGASWVLLGASWAHLASHGRLRPRFWSPRGSISNFSGLDFRPLRARFWSTPCLRLHSAGIAARNPSWRSLGLFFPTLQRGGTCAAHGIGAKLAQMAPKCFGVAPLELS